MVLTTSSQSHGNRRMHVHASAAPPLVADGHNVDHALELMHAARERLRA